MPVVLSGKSEEALRAQAERLRLAVEGGRVLPELSAVGRSLALGRSRFEHRAVVLAGGVEELRSGLETVALGGGSVAGVVRGVAGSSVRPVFVFPGQGAQWVGMAAGLLESSAVFAGRMAECAVALEGFTDWSLLDVVRGEEGVPGFDRVDVVQPVLWAVMVSLAELWRVCGVVPAAVIGHSQGEIAAAVVAGCCRWRTVRGWWPCGRKLCWRCRVVVAWFRCRFRSWRCVSVWGCGGAGFRWLR
ncbi:acyltransferase domain-containing protein [Streptomyces sp. SCSIO-PteL053]|nr:acyltransferase domain-containing protein [Streptomyces sp. SCSIO-PteL053]